jgi:hyperosmotically inducible protein
MSWRPSLQHALLLAALGSPGATHGQEPQGAGADTDALLEERIERRLAWDRELAPFRLAVEVNDAVVNLIGTVSTIPESHRARRIANDTVGVIGVVNGVAIDPALEAFAGTLMKRPDDATLAQRISESLAEDLSVDATDIEVTVEDGHVVLGGQVSDAAHRERAERIARSLFGVRSLVNGIR